MTVRASDDAYAGQLVPDRNNNTEKLVAGSRPGDRKVTYLKFAVPRLPTGASDVTAQLWLTRDLHHLPPSVELSEVADTRWSEQTLTMTNSPPLTRWLARATPTRETTELAFMLPTGTVTG
ncbi:MAG: hypothetical protein H0U09_11865, partial [Geodermatophilaceae bacterium]|nr:hypothetical protein [Geodermatophilaceae bacterium]